MKNIVLLIFSVVTLNVSGVSAPDYTSAVESVRSTLGQIVAADSTNPPGNEALVAAIAAKRLKKAGIPFELLDFGPNRKNLVATLKGNGNEKPVMILAHMDVVGTADQKWTSNPHEMVEKDGYLVGRGVLDDLGMAAIGVEVLILMKESGFVPNRDILLVLSGDEESGGTGIQDLVAKKPELLDVAVVLNEGGGLRLAKDGKVNLVALQVAEKTYQDFTLIAKGTTGHSSVPLKENAIYKLARALDRIGKNPAPARLIEATRGYLSEHSQVESGPLAAAMKTLSDAKKATLPRKALAEVEKEPLLSATLRTTCVATTLSGGTRVNALPAEVRANINCRILPDETPGEVMARLRRVIDDDSLEIQTMGDFGAGGPSPVTGFGPQEIKKIAQQMWPKVPIIPFLSVGATDSRFFRMKGVPCYGINPIAVTDEDARRAHGIDERIPVSSLSPGIEFFHRLLLELTSAPQAQAG